MKRIYSVFLCMCLLLSACNQAPAENTTTLPTTEATTEVTTEATTEATTESTTEATTEPFLYQHPLNGQPLESPWSGRPTAVVLNNIRQCLPQSGISSADLIYEFETEGGITRMLGIFSQLEGVGNIGPIRSARSYFNSVALSYDAPIVHCGGSPEGRNGHYSDNGDKIDGWAHLDETYNPQYFFRDQARLDAGYSTEHTLFANGKNLLQALKDKGLATPHAQGTDYGLAFSQDASVSGASANTVTVIFTNKKTSTMKYDAETGKYDFYQYDFLQTDGNSGDAVTFTNILALNTHHWNKRSGSYLRSYYELVGSGTGYYAMGGQIVPIRWSRQALRGPLTFTLEDGTPLTLAPGNTYIAFSGIRDYISYN